MVRVAPARSARTPRQAEEQLVYFMFYRLATGKNCQAVGEVVARSVLDSRVFTEVTAAIFESAGRLRTGVMNCRDTVHLAAAPDLGSEGYSADISRAAS